MAAHLDVRVAQRMGFDVEQAGAFQNDLKEMPTLGLMLNPSWNRDVLQGDDYSKLLRTVGDLYKQDPDSVHLLEEAVNGRRNDDFMAMIRRNDNKAQLDAFADRITADPTLDSVLTPTERALGRKMGLDETETRKLHLEMEDMPYLRKKMSDRWFGDEMAQDPKYDNLLRAMGDVFKQDPAQLRALDQSFESFGDNGYSAAATSRAIRFRETLENGSAQQLDQLAGDIRVAHLKSGAPEALAAAPAPLSPAAQASIAAAPAQIDALIAGNDVLFDGLIRALAPYQDPVAEFAPTPFGEMKPGHADQAQVKDLQNFLRRQLMAVDGKDPFARHDVDGIYDGARSHETSNAVQRWQEQHNMEGSGIVDAATARAMNNARALEQQRDGFGYSQLLEASAQLMGPDFVKEVGPIPAGDAPMTEQGYLHLMQAASVRMAGQAHAASPDKETTTALQQVLATKYDLGNSGKNGDGIDGVAGRLTVDALKAYQRDAGLKDIGFLPNGQLDPVTDALLEYDRSQMITVSLPGVEGPETVAETARPRRLPGAEMGR